MADEQTDKRPWWKKRRFIGGSMYVTGLCVLAIPAAWVPAAVVLFVGGALVNVGGFVAGYGFGAKNVRTGVDK